MCAVKRVAVDGGNHKEGDLSDYRIVGAIELLSILGGFCWLLFNLGRWMERREERAGWKEKERLS